MLLFLTPMKVTHLSSGASSSGLESFLYKNAERDVGAQLGCKRKGFQESEDLESFRMPSWLTFVFLLNFNTIRIHKFL